MARTSALFFVLALSLPACNMEQRYVTPVGGFFNDTATTETTPVFLEAELEALVMVETPILFPIHGPNDMEMDALWAEPVMPFPRRPWVERDDYQIEIDIVVSNLDPSRRVLATVTLNGINEFNEYLPAAQIVDEDLVVDFASWERTYALDAGERRMVTVREEELDEVAVDLASVVNGMECMTIANTITYFMNQSSSDPRSMPCVPAMIPGLVGVKLGLRTQIGIGETPPRIVVEATVRMRDVRDRVAAAGEMAWDLNGEVPVPFTPPVMMDPP